MWRRTVPPHCASNLGVRRSSLGPAGRGWTADTDGWAELDRDTLRASAQPNHEDTGNAGLESLRMP